ncbi:hypothetical protein OEZ86_008123 [Tetradesmus obliquus]|nr:hypothetical protein OEZ86_008123 [Tetradesmus obliquus]
MHEGQQQLQQQSSLAASGTCRHAAQAPRAPSNQGAAPQGFREIAAGQQQQQQQQHQQQQQEDAAEGEAVSRKQSAPSSSSSSSTTYRSSEAAADNRICPPEDQFLLFRWLMAQPLRPDAEQMTAASLSADYKKTMCAVPLMCMTNTVTGELMKECCLDHFKACVQQLGLTRQQQQDISLAWSVFQSIHAAILQEVCQLQQQLGLAELPASSSMLSHLTRCADQNAQLDRLLLLQNKGSMLRNCFAYHMFGCMSWAQWGKLGVLLAPFTPIATVVAQAVSQIDAAEREQAAELQRQQQQRRRQQQQQQQEEEEQLRRRSSDGTEVLE